MLWFLIVVLFSGILMFIYMFILAHRNHLDVREIKENAYQNKQPLQIFFISDIHNRKIQDDLLKKVDLVDIVIIGGDLVDKRTSMSRLEHNLSLLKKWNAPVYFIPGNNDHELRGRALIDLLDDHGIHTLSNADNIVYLDNGIMFVLSGLDPYYLKPRRNTSYIKDRNHYQILCVHDPYVFKNMNKDDQERFDLVLSGHTHGGQIRILGTGPYERGGWFGSKDQQHLVSEGYGTSMLPLRLGTRAEYHLIQIKPTDEL